MTAEVQEVRAKSQSDQEMIYVPGTAGRLPADQAQALGAAKIPHGKNWSAIYTGERMTLPAECELVRAGWRPPAPVDSAAEVAFREARKYRALVTHGSCNPVSASDARIQEFIFRAFSGTPLPSDIGLQLPNRDRQVVLSEAGIARKLSLPKGEMKYETPQICSYSLGEHGEQGILHNTGSSKRTTQGTFHVVESGQLVPAGKIAVPRDVAAKIISFVLNEYPKQHSELMEVPYTAHSEHIMNSWTTISLRPQVMPELPGISCSRFSDVSVMAPGRFVSNLDFLEEIFGNAGDPFDINNDAALDIGWSGTSHKMIFCPELHKFLTKRQLGISSQAELLAILESHPEHSDESRRAARRLEDGMYWKKPDELYNNGSPFKLVLRNASGNSLTIITDNYFGYGKKSIKSEAISLVSNVMGLAEEEHAGGALAQPREDVGRFFSYESNVQHMRERIEISEVIDLLDDRIIPHGNYAMDKYLKIVYLDDDAKISVDKGKVYWDNGLELNLDSSFTYMYPDGVCINFEKEAKTEVWRLVLTYPEGAYVHKPNTVSGAGKSEISKMLADAMSVKHFTVDNFDSAMQKVRDIVTGQYGHRFSRAYKAAQGDWDDTRPSRPILDPERSIGSVIKLLTPSEDYIPEYNNWLKNLPPHIKKLVVLVKRRYRPDMGDQWDKHYSVDDCDGAPTRVLRFKSTLDAEHFIPIKERELRVGYNDDGSERKFSLRADFMPATKQQMEDDITFSGIVSGKMLLEGLSREQARAFKLAAGGLSFKLTGNAEYFLFQRPDGAKNRGEDRKTEQDFATKHGTFFANFEPLTRLEAKSMVSMPEVFDRFSLPMQKLIRRIAAGSSASELYFVSSDQARIERDADGNAKLISRNGRELPFRSDNPRFLEATSVFDNGEPQEVSDIARHLQRRIAIGQRAYLPVDGVVSGQRFSPSEEKKDSAGSISYTKPLLTNNPLHYLPLPEYLMSIIPSLTPKSVSTTGGAGTEGVNTKEAFNALPGIYDIESTLVSSILTRTDNFVSAGGYLGPRYRIDHDVSVLIPEIWSRMTRQERTAEWLIANDYLEKIEVNSGDGKPLVDADILGYRTTKKFWLHMGGRVFNAPDVLFEDEMLRPETQDQEVFEASLQNMLEAQRSFAKRFFDDGTIALASEPVKVLLHIMRDGSYTTQEGRIISRHSPEFREMFTYDYLIQSDWYAKRLDAQQTRECEFWTERTSHLAGFIKKNADNFEIGELETYKARLAQAQNYLKRARSAEFRQALEGTIGVHPQTLSQDEGYFSASPEMHSGTASISQNATL